MILSEAEIQEKLKTFRGWEFRDGKLTKTYRFADFAKTMALANQAAVLAEQINHHPDMLIHYNRITFFLSTHSAGAITHKDFLLLKGLEQLALETI